MKFNFPQTNTQIPIVSVSCKSVVPIQLKNLHAQGQQQPYLHVIEAFPNLQWGSHEKLVL
jgi:hypothetical protein